MNEPTSLASWTRALRKQLDAIGLDSAALCLQAGLDPLRVEESNAQFPLSATNALWQLAVQASGDPAIGLRVARFVSPSTFHSLGYALIASENLREVFERIVRYHQASDALTPTLSRENGRYVLRLQATDDYPAPAAEAIDAFAAIYVRTCRNRLGPDYAPLAVRLTRARPQDPKPWLTVFRSPIHFDAEQDSLEFACADFDCHLDDASPQDASPEMLQPLTWERRVGDAIERCLPRGVPSADEVAEVMRLSLRNLQRHLADEGCRFDALLDQCQQNLALQYLNDPDLPLSEIGHRLGFADAGTFIRAFKRWTGISPGQYRNNLA
ncbi:MAG: AraC family transcriptional regulator [Pseudomonas sp.]|uniref:AraC family transcriptional regulator n=1 Tax=Pseudomonas abieticivorans TaxID=2931382 RepID=UPI0020BFE629|nr:AraC family transcriptional regulator [Pseudomonas sp. PIA16]MDE1168287.1 AraC family transcriptional regulator [Pseudomonas sp.]